MGKLRPPDDEDVRVNVRPNKSGGAPWVRLYLHRYPGDKNGELIEHFHLSEDQPLDEMARDLGRIVFAGSPFLQEWLRQRDAEEPGQNP